MVGQVKKRLPSFHWNNYTVHSNLMWMDAYISILIKEYKFECKWTVALHVQYLPEARRL